jgi:DNA (cytosine-5)-methyltransferase 1
MIKVGSDFSGVGAFNQALNRLGIQYKEVFACDMDKYARQTFIHNYGEPDYYPTNVYEREIPTESLDIYMTSPPCQAFSLAGKRLGKEDKRGILFFNSLEFIQVNQPRFFIFENVKGLLSDNGGKTFSEWVNLLGGKSVNGSPVLFPYDDSVNYHLYWQVLNAKHHGVPQNRERVFLIGIRDDADNNFRFPTEEVLTKRLKDVLESEVDEKFFLSDKMISYISKDRQGNENLVVNREVANAITCEIKKMQRSMQDNYIKITSANSKGYEEATEGDSINLEFPESKTRRGRVGKGVAQTLDTVCNQGVICGAIRGRGENNEQTLELNSEEYTNSITTVQKDNVIVKPLQIGQSEKTFAYQNGTILGKEDQEAFCIRAAQPNGVCIDYKIRRLTPRECFRLMDFPDTFIWPVSDSQAYKQAGNSIVVNVLYKILKNLNL